MTESDQRDFYASLNTNRVNVQTKIIELSKISDSFCKISEYSFGNYKIEYMRWHPNNSIQVSVFKNNFEIGSWTTGCEPTADQKIIFEMLLSVLKRCNEKTDALQRLHQHAISQDKSK